MNAILDFQKKHKITDVTILNPYQLPKFRDGKATIIDVKAKDQSGVFFIKEAETLEVIPEEIDDEGLRSAFEQANIQTWSEEELEAYDYAGLRETEDRLRLEKAKADARKEEQRKMAQQMKQDNIDREVIKKYTGLSDEEIDEI